MLRYLLLPVACAAALTTALPPSALAQTASAPAADDEALRNIQSNFARMAPPPRTMQSINQTGSSTAGPRANARMALRDVAGSRRPTAPTQTASRPPRPMARRRPTHRPPMARRPQPTRKPAGRANADSSLR